jgi:hypothetical protein
MCWKRAKTNATATAHGPPPVVPPPNLLISFPRPNSASRRSKNCFTLGFCTVTGGELDEGGVGTQRIREGVSEGRPKPHLISSNRILTEKPVAPFRIHPSGQPSAATQTIMRQISPPPLLLSSLVLRSFLQSPPNPLQIRPILRLTLEQLHCKVCYLTATWPAAMYVLEVGDAWE